MAAEAAKLATNQGLGRAQKLRIGGLLGFIALMPVLAVPAVNEPLDEWLFSSLFSASSEPLADRLTRVRERPSAANAVNAASAASGSAESEEWPEGRPLVRLGVEGVSRLPPVEGGISPAAFDALQARLQDLGASYYRLEDRREEGDGTPLYRFRCEVPLPGNENYLRPFEADDRDPVRAMQLVVEEVEVWLARHRLTAAQWSSPPAAATPANGAPDAPSRPLGGNIAPSVVR